MKTRTADYNPEQQAFDTPVVSGSSLEEAIVVMQSLLSYGRIYTITGVSYVEGTHKEMLDKAERWLNKARQNCR